MSDRKCDSKLEEIKNLSSLAREGFSFLLDQVNFLSKRGRSMRKRKFTKFLKAMISLIELDLPLLSSRLIVTLKFPKSTQGIG